MRFRVTAVLAALAGFAAAASNVLELDSSTFDKHIGQGVPALVEFYAPWCGHCKNLAPIYEQLGDAYAHVKDKVLIVKVDADGEGRDVGQKHGVGSFPTLKWFGPDSAEESTPYEGARELDALAAFVAEKSGVKAKVKAAPPSAVVTLDYKNWDDIIYDESKDVLVAFTAPWCGHCKKLKPEFEKLARNFELDTQCVVANIDADAVANKAIAKEFEVTGYPTLKFFRKAKKARPPLDYDGARSLEALTDYLNEHCGTFRTASGMLNDKAGRFVELDQYAAEYVVADAEARKSIFKKARMYAADLSFKRGDFYIKVMEKLKNDSGNEYLAKETKRLNSILAKKTLTQTKLDEIKKKANILAQFVVKKAEDVVEAVEETVQAVLEKGEEAAHKIKDEL